MLIAWNSNPVWRGLMNGVSTSLAKLPTCDASKKSSMCAFLMPWLAGEQSPDAAQRLNATFDEQAQLRAASEASARALLDAETILRVFNADDDDALAQVIREYVHKDYNLLLTARDRLRRQINAMLVMGRSAASEGYATILQTLADESAQLELERDQQQRRLESIKRPHGLAGTRH